MPMRPRTRTMVAGGLLLAAALNSFAGDVKVIANQSIKADSISSEELRSIFLLRRKTLKDGSWVVPVLEREGSTHKTFLRVYLNRDANELQTYYQGLVFTGKGTMPKELTSDAAVVAFVAQTPGAIGYVDSNSKTEGVKVLAVLVSGRNGERALLRRVEPEYPDTLKRLQIGGTVRLEVVISPKGTVEQVSILGGNPALAESAVKAVMQWVYAPASSQTRQEVSIPFQAHP